MNSNRTIETMRRVARLLLLTLAIASVSMAQIQFDQARKVWLITSPHSSYAMGVGPSGELQHLYWGGPITRMEDVPAAQEKKDISSFDPHQMLETEEFPGWGGPRYYEPALKITREDGVRDLVLRYVSHKIAGTDLDIALKDINDPIEVMLRYHVYPDHGVLRRSATIRNGTQRTLTVESAQSAVWNLP